MIYCESLEIGIINSEREKAVEILKVFLDDVSCGKDFVLVGRRLISIYHMKLYTYENDMLAFSKKYPDVVFVVYGEGECIVAQWKEYYQNGKRQYAPGELIFPTFDPSKLK